MKLLIVLIMGVVVSAAPADNSSPPESQPGAAEGSPADHQQAGAQEQQKVQPQAEEKQKVQENTQEITAEFLFEGKKPTHKIHPIECKAEIQQGYEINFVNSGESKLEQYAGAYTVECGMLVDIVAENGPKLATYYDSCKVVCVTHCQVIKGTTNWNVDDQLEQTLERLEDSAAVKEELFPKMDKYVERISESNEQPLLSMIYKLVQQLNKKYTEINKTRVEAIYAMTEEQKQERYQTAMQALKQIGEGQSDGKDNNNDNDPPKQN